MKSSKVALACALIGLSLSGLGTTAQAQSFSEGFNDAPAGWLVNNLSSGHANGSDWSIATGITMSGVTVVTPQEGDAFAAVDYTSVGNASGVGTISNWLISPEISGIQNGDTFSFYTTTGPGSEFPDRLQFRLSTAGAGSNVGTSTTSVGTFTTLLADVNPGLDVGGYPETWTQVSVTVSGLSAPVDGRVAFRYFVTNGGPAGDNSNIIGVDNFSYTSVSAVPEPASWALMLGGTVGLLGLQRRRRQGDRA